MPTSLRGLAGEPPGKKGSPEPKTTASMKKVKQLLRSLWSLLQTLFRDWHLTIPDGACFHVFDASRSPVCDMAELKFQPAQDHLFKYCALHWTLYYKHSLSKKETAMTLTSILHTNMIVEA